MTLMRESDSYVGFRMRNMTIWANAYRKKVYLT